MGFTTALLRIGAIVAAAVVATPASADNLFDLLFGGPVKRNGESPRLKRNGDPMPPAPDKPVQKARPAAKPVKITGPTYYTYKADAIRPIDFATLAGLDRNVVFAPGAADPFAEALPLLDGYVLPAEPEIAAAVIGWYRDHPGYLWVQGTSPTSRAGEAIRILGESGKWGLNAAEYAVDVPSASFDANDPRARNAALIRFEMALSARLLRYVRDVSVGRIDPNKLSGYHDLPVKPVNLRGVMEILATSHDLRAYLLSRHPQMPEYQQLAAELETLDDAGDDAIAVNLTNVVRPGQANPDFPKIVELIRRKGDSDFLAAHGAVLDAHAASETYDQALVEAVKAAQKAAGLSPDGVIGPRTVQALAGVSDGDKAAKIRVALEELRWMPRAFEPRRVFINQAAFTATYFVNGAEALAMRVVVGKPSNQTSFFIDEIERVEFNPYWGVPASILVNEMLPRLRRDPGYLDRAGYEVVDAKGKKISSSSVNWGAYGAKIPFGVRQVPGEANALGELKILFPNKHAIYMHDTPSRDLFSRDTRAFSHGCVRLEKPRDMAAAVLGWNVDEVAAKLKKGHSGIDIPSKIPVYVAYFTAWPKAGGGVDFFADIYQRDAHLLESLKRVEEARASQG
ncbi:MAG: L,D-transpeptidase family protein [Phyllobacteriaceae bacterium]|nr:L,D-transpeptidase family protein [Phyllobacteriaceae bacterium]